ncbi:hypothetical protein FO519_009312 [Halicephalobus sp. NKZ332]|nr:hypothetical protein FO519_009312 [Halicephalobus sp. NKZ332]
MEGAQLLHEFDNYHLDILGISEMRWTGNGKITSDGKTILYSEHENLHTRRVGLILNKEASQALIGWKPVSERIITARLQARYLKTTIVQAYSPTEEAENAEKDVFYDLLQNTLNEIPSYDLIIFTGDLSAQIGKCRHGLEQTTGPHGSAALTNNNGDTLTSFCGINGLGIGNTYFAYKNIHKKTWRSLGRNIHNEIDYICISNRCKEMLTVLFHMEKIIYIFALIAVAWANQSVTISDVDACQLLLRQNSMLEKNETIRALDGFVGVGWDDLTNRATIPILKTTYKACKRAQDGAFFVPDNILVVPVLKTSLDRMANIYQNFKEYTKQTDNTITASAGVSYGYWDVSGSFSFTHQEVKSTFYQQKSIMLHSKMIHHTYTLITDGNTGFNDGFVARLKQIVDALEANNYPLAKYFAESTIRDYGTHIVFKADVGAVIEQETFVASQATNSSSTTLDALRASASGIFQIDELVAFSNEGIPIDTIITTANLPLFSPDRIYILQDIIRNATKEYYERNTIRGCTEMSSPNFNYQANVDDNSCEPSNTTFQFDGVFQKCTPLSKKYIFFYIQTPSWRCNGLTQVNPMTKGFTCQENYEPVLISSIIHMFSDRTEEKYYEECNSFLFWENCNTVKYTVINKDNVQIDSYWCRAKPNVKIPPNTGAMFGGIYTTSSVNVFTGSTSCPGTYVGYRLFADLTVCISYDYQMDMKYAIPFNSFFSCQSSQKKCESGYTQHLVEIFDGCAVFYCVTPDAYRSLENPVIKRPPFTNVTFATSKYPEDTILAFYKTEEVVNMPIVNVVKKHAEQLQRTKISGTSKEIFLTENDVQAAVDVYMNDSSKQILDLIDKYPNKTWGEIRELVAKEKPSSSFILSNLGYFIIFIVFSVVVGVIVLVHKYRQSRQSQDGVLPDQQRLIDPDIH